jgi:hypothetical protein
MESGDVIWLLMQAEQGVAARIILLFHANYCKSQLVQCVYPIRLDDGQLAITSMFNHILTKEIIKFESFIQTKEGKHVITVLANEKWAIFAYIILTQTIKSPKHFIFSIYQQGDIFGINFAIQQAGQTDRNTLARLWKE